MSHMFALHDGQFDNVYHRRSQAESTDSASKRKMGEPLLSKGATSRRNGVRCEMIGDNIRALITEMFRVVIDPISTFLKPRRPGMNSRDPSEAN
jgi:hypothetical protein